MRTYLIFIALLFLRCGDSKKMESTHEIKKIPTKTAKRNIDSEAKLLDSTYRCENDNFISVLEEVPNTESNAYKLTIFSKHSNDTIIKILDTRPQMSKINYCNEFYTVVGFPCGGPCYSRVFIFTDKNRPTEQYTYPQETKNNANIIAHIEDEEFENLIIHNFSTSKELTVNISDSNPWNYGQMDSMIVEKDNLILYYQSKGEKQITKKVNLKTIL